MSDPAGWEDDETAEDIAAYAARMSGLAPSRLSEDPEEGRLIAGAICRAYLGIVEALFDDVCALRHNPAALANLETQVICRLPLGFRSGYDAGFAQRFLTAAVDLGTSMATEFTHPASTAQELVLRLVLDEASNLDDALGLGLSEGWRYDVEDRLFMDMDHEVLYASLPDDVTDEVQDKLGMVTLAFEDWFESFAHHEGNPYSADRPLQGG